MYNNFFIFQYLRIWLYFSYKDNNMVERLMVPMECVFFITVKRFQAEGMFN